MKIDAHQHFWIYDPGQYPWITEASKRIRNDFLPSDLETDLARAGLSGSVAVQARQSLEETRWLLELADRHPKIRGVVGWVDLRSPTVGDSLAEFAKHQKFVGVRHVVQDEPDDRFLLRPDFLRGLERLREFNLTYDLLVFPKQLPAAIEVVRRFSDQPFVLDHLAKPAIRSGTLSPWDTQVKELAQFPNVSCKLSGLVTEAAWEHWQKSDFRPYLDVAFAAFGEDRLMFGSDWPVCLLSATYGQVFDLIDDYLGRFSGSVREKVFGINAAQFYRLRAG